MSARLIDGKALAAQVRSELAARVAALTARGITPGLAVMLVGDDPASAIYVRNKIKACEETGIRSYAIHLPATVTQQELLARIRAWNADINVHGILVQLPLPPPFDAQRVIESIDPRKDVDGLHPENAGLLLLGRPQLPSCTPAGVMRMLEAAGCNPAGQHAVVIGRSIMVGRPMAMLLLAADATVTLCHSRTPDLSAITRQADILIAAAGRRGLVTADMVKPGAVVIDVGIHRTPDGRVVGDVDFDQVRHVAGALSPVPGGVGPMTIAMLLHNTVRAAELAVDAARGRGVQSASD